MRRGKFYYGEVGVSEFLISPRLWYQAGGYLLSVNGVATPRVSGASISLRFRALNWFIVIAVLAVWELTILVTNADGGDTWWVVLGFGAFYHSLGCGVHWLQTRKALRDLREILADAEA
jgi:hypothetical protein